ncbi:MAG: tRNA (N6-isopentenyl adenosine(37)-C2)-methylthiotransferase MiaB [Deltaproteobacteria bacterium]|jgi:tRNA-2-methylthio-N6-dimethylallyladenosine synthase|nr:tRNA (N6-isopentenyl adenosine(37)-C2)-methylthiotransferase MiaB [Deltaproteobacteria bacterium]
MKRYHVITFGCQMNFYDSERLMGLLAERGWLPAETMETADFIFLNACSIRAKAAQRVITRLLELKPFKKKRPELLIGVGGCLAEQEGANFLQKVPFLSLVAGPRRLLEIPELLATLDPQGPAQILVGNGAPQPTRPILAPDRSVLSSSITIMEGCDNFCAYCVVPYLRGRETSRPPQDILQEAASLIAQGCREITLLGQNVNSYAPAGASLGDREPAFVTLLKKLASFPDLWRLRFTTSHPKDFSARLIELFGSLPVLAPRLHLPLQSGSDKVLKAMGRHYDLQQYFSLVDQLRRAQPGLSLSTDIIVGFPGETEEDHQLTIEALEKIRFDAIFSFKYSDRPQTRAINLPDKLSEEEKGRRLTQIQQIQRAITLDINQALVGQTVSVLVTGPGRRPGQMSGRDGTLKIVNFPGPPELYGQMVSTRVTEAYHASLLGQLAQTPETEAKSA